MRRLLILPAFASLALAIAACGGGTEPGWTVGPSPATQPPASPSGSAGPSGSASPSGSVAPSASPSGSPAGDVVQISAAGVKFEQASVQVPAGAAFTITFDNKDAGQLHNVEIKDAGGASLFRGEIVTGPAVAEYAVPAIPAGSYQFVCSVHPTMVGTLTAG